MTARTSCVAIAGVAFACLVTLGASVARATPPAPPTPGYPEPVIQWGVQKGETCEDIAKSLYGSPKLTPLLQRYNRVACKSGAALREGLTLVVPATATQLPDARLRSMNPDVRARPGGGAWAPAATGMPLFSNYNVNTLDQGRADVEFVDRTRVFLAPNTLVVIYGTASQTRVSKSPKEASPAVVEVEEGEVKAGLAALRGGGEPREDVQVAIKGGGLVTASSHDTVVQRKGTRTTVAVFDGKAGVSSGGKVIDVPKNFGTRFVGVTPPAPPRPLPPAPEWAPDNVPGALAPHDAKGVVNVAWQPAKNALAYRIELLRDAQPEPQIISRQEVPPTTTAFRGELAPGAYKLVVRAIDKEEYLGIAAEQPILVVEAAATGTGASLAPGAGSQRTIDVNPYGEIVLPPDPDLEMSLDGGPFTQAPAKIDLSRAHPKEIRLRKKGGAGLVVETLRYADVVPSFTAPLKVEGGKVAVSVSLSHVEGDEEAKRVKPSVRARLADGRTLTALLVRGADGRFTASLEAPQTAPDAASDGAALSAATVEIVDGHGHVLGTADVAVVAAARMLPPVIRFGAYAPLWQASPVTDVLWSAPTAIDGASVGTVLAKGTRTWGVQAEARGSGNVGPVGLDAAIRSDSTDGTTLASAWLGARWRVFRMVERDDPAATPRQLDGAFLPRFELAPLVRLALPVTPTGAPPQIEPALALGGGAERLTWLVDVGGRARLGSDANGTGVPKGQGFVLAGGSFDAVEWLRLHAVLDGHLAAPDTGKLFFRGGLEAGLEAGTRVFGGLAVRLSPTPDTGTGVFMGGLTLGYRACGSECSRGPASGWHAAP